MPNVEQRGTRATTGKPRFAETPHQERESDFSVFLRNTFAMTTGLAVLGRLRLLDWLSRWHESEME